MLRLFVPPCTGCAVQHRDRQLCSLVSPGCARPPPCNVLPSIKASSQALCRPYFTRCQLTAAVKHRDVGNAAVSAPILAATANQAREYDAESIQVLEGLEPVRKRPGMYIGSTGTRGLHHLVWEVLDNAIDEVQGGHANEIYVDVDLTSGWVAITDDGRGIPTSIHPRTGKSAVETVLTVLHAGGKFGGDNSGYRVSGGLHGVGLSVVNALAEGLEVTVWRGGVQYSQAYGKGVPLTPLVQLDMRTVSTKSSLGDEHAAGGERPANSRNGHSNGHRSTAATAANISNNGGSSHGGSSSDASGSRLNLIRRGTRVAYKADTSVFALGVTLDPDTLRARLRELAFLNSGATIYYRARHLTAPKEAGSKAGGKVAGADGDSVDDGQGARVHPPAQFAAGWDDVASAENVVREPLILPRTSSVGGVADSSMDAESGGEDGENGDSAGGRDGSAAASTSGRGGRAKSSGAKAVRSRAAVGARKGVVKGKAAASATDMDTMDERSSGSSSVSGSGNSLGPTPGSSWQMYRYEGGLREYVAWLNRDKTPLHEPIFLRRDVEGVQVEVALQWCSDAFSDNMVGFANSIRTGDGGTHLDGLRAGLTRAVNTQVKKKKLLKEGDPTLQADHIREGLGAVVSVKVPDPEFEGQTKTRLGNPEVRRIVESAINQHLSEHLELHPQTLSIIVAKALQAARAADAAKKARDLVRRKSILTKSTLPGKLADCTSDHRAETEIFLVEGDSAGGSAKQARDRRTQAVLPLRGKILNVERSDDASVYKNNEISNLIIALGLGTHTASSTGSSADSNSDTLRYGKVIILTDADVDGAHIRTLLLTFLFRYRRALFEQGHVYVAVPPLYKVEVNSSKRLTWCFNDAERDAAVKGLSQGAYSVQRFKGLGEMMPAQLWDTTLNPATRLLRRLTIDDAAAASEMFTLLMGDKVAPRRALVEEHGSRISLADLDV